MFHGKCADMLPWFNSLGYTCSPNGADQLAPCSPASGQAAHASLARAFLCSLRALSGTGAAVHSVQAVEHTSSSAAAASLTVLTAGCGNNPWLAAGSESDWVLDLVATGFSKPEDEFGHTMRSKADIDAAADAFSTQLDNVTVVACVVALADMGAVYLACAGAVA